MNPTTVAPSVTRTWCRKWGGRRDSNPRQPESQSGTLPAELRPPLRTVACPTGLEPVTPSLEGWCSIRMSYGHQDSQVETVAFRGDSQIGLGPRLPLNATLPMIARSTRVSWHAFPGAPSRRCEHDPGKKCRRIRTERGSFARRWVIEKFGEAQNNSDSSARWTIPLECTK